MKTFLTYLAFFSSLSFPWADGRTEQQLQRDLETSVQRKHEQMKAQVQEYLSAPVRQEPAYVWTPDGRLQGWQLPDATGNIQQYSIDGDWTGTIYK